MNQKIKFFVYDYGLLPFSSLEETINKWIEKENRASNLKMVVDSTSHNVYDGRTYSVLVLYHYESCYSGK